MNLLVTGGCGFIGSNYINYTLKTQNVKIYNLDCLNYCSNENNVTQHSNYKFIKGNILNKDLVLFILNEYHIDTVVHFAAQSHVDNSFDNSKQYMEDNCMGTLNLIQCCKEYGHINKFIHISTDEVYGEVDIEHPGCTEKSLLNPTNPYAATKAGAEMMVRSFVHSFHFPAIVIRCNNVYGYNQYPEKLIPKFIKLLKEGKKMTIHGKGETRRNFIWVDDVTRAIDVVIEKGVIGETYNIGTDTEYSVMEVAKILCSEINGCSIEGHVEYVEDRPFNDFRYKIDCSKLKELGWIEKDVDFVRNVRGLSDCL